MAITSTSATVSGRWPRGRGVAHHHRIVAGETAVTIGGVDRAHARHALIRQFRRAQRPDAGRADHRNALCQHRQYLLVPNARAAFEQAVDQADGGGAHGRRAQQVAAAGGRAQVDGGGQGRAPQARPGEQDRRAHAIAGNDEGRS